MTSIYNYGDNVSSIGDGGPGRARRHWLLLGIWSAGGMMVGWLFPSATGFLVPIVALGVAAETLLRASETTRGARHWRPLVAAVVAYIAALCMSNLAVDHNLAELRGALVAYRDRNGMYPAELRDLPGGVPAAGLPGTLRRFGYDRSARADQAMLYYAYLWPLGTTDVDLE